jgi:hypothetical protein
MHLESELEVWLRRMVPGCEDHWIGASSAEIETIEFHAGRPLPHFYKWFLATMGRDMGPLGVPGRDMSVSTILSVYKQGFTPYDPNLFLIEVDSDEVMPSYIFYDFSRPARDDALVCSCAPEGGFRYDEFETLRERLAWGTFIRFRDRGCTAKVAGTFVDSSCSLLENLDPILKSLRFSKVIRSGVFCGIYDRNDAGLRCSVPPGREQKPYMFFDLVGNDQAILRTVLGTIVTETSLEVEIEKWDPPLPG